MQLRPSRSLGSLNVDGELHVIVYDIPGMFDGAAGAAGGFVWFREEARSALAGAANFQLVSTSGARVEGRVVQRHGLSAAVVVQPVVAFKAEARRSENAFTPNLVIAAMQDNVTVNSATMLAAEGT